MLDHIELNEIIENLIAKITEEITCANRMGNLDEVLKRYNYQVDETAYYERNIAKILVIGGSEVKVNSLKKVIKAHNIDISRFEFILDYNEASIFPMNTLKNNPKYCDIFMGPIPHKTKGMGNCNSIISEIEHNKSEYPKLTKLIASNELKITKNSFEQALLNSVLYKEILNSY